MWGRSVIALEVAHLGLNGGLDGGLNAGLDGVVVHGGRCTQRRVNTWDGRVGSA